MCSGGGTLALWWWWVVGAMGLLESGLWRCSKGVCRWYKGLALPEGREAFRGRLRSGGRHGHGPVGSTLLPGPPGAGSAIRN